MSTLSLLQPRSIGIVAENKARDSHEVAVAPIELFPGLDGEIIDAVTSREVSGTDKTGTKYTVTLETSPAVIATWLPLTGSNRVSSPDVRRGEQVVLYQYADHDRYYWTTLGIHDDLRRLETVLYAFSATSDETEALDPLTNMYIMEVSTHDQHITLHTTQANGEPFEYTLKLDTAAGSFTLTDQDENKIVLNSAERVIQAINSDLSEIKIDKTKIYAYAKEDITAKSDGTMTAQSKKDMTAKTDANLLVKVAGDATVDVGGNADVKVGGNIVVDVTGTADYKSGGAANFTAGGAVEVKGSGVVTVTNGGAKISLAGGIVSLN